MEGGGKQQQTLTVRNGLLRVVYAIIGQPEATFGCTPVAGASKLQATKATMVGPSLTSL